MASVIIHGKVVRVRTLCNPINHWIRSCEDGQWYKNAKNTGRA